MGLIGWPALILDRVAARLFPRLAAEGPIGRSAPVIVGIATAEVAIELRQWFAAIVVAASAVAERLDAGQRLGAIVVTATVVAERFDARQRLAAVVVATALFRQTGPLEVPAVSISAPTRKAIDTQRSVARSAANCHDQ